MSFLNDLIFRLNKPKVILLAGISRREAASAISEVLKGHFKIGKNVFIFETDFTDPEKDKFLVKNSSKPILAVTNIGEIPEDKIPFAGEEEKITAVKEFVKNLQKSGHLVVNFDDETVRMTKNESCSQVLTFGLQEGADLRAGDFTTDDGTNFKVSYGGSIVPFWIGNDFTKERIYAVLAAAACGLIFGLNLVEISQALKGYK
ncbi:MAG: Mur ligase family protein [Patescibacteria group bacterium]